MKIADLPFEPGVPKKDIDAAAETAASIALGGNANFDILSKGVAVPYRSRICHAGLGYPTTFDKTSVAFYTDLPGERSDRFLYWNWLLKRSFASRFVAHIGNNYVVVDAGIPPQLMQNIAIMIRHIRELRGLPCFTVFNELVGRGYSEELAYVVSFNSSISTSNPAEFRSCRFYDAGGGHRAWNLFRLDAFIRFLDGDFGEGLSKVASLSFKNTVGMVGGRQFCDNPTARAGYPSTGNPTFVHDAFTRYPDLLEKVKKSRLGESIGDAVPNPFIRPSDMGLALRTDPLAATTGEVLDIVIPFLVEKGVLR